MVNLQNVNLPKSQPVLKMTNNIWLTFFGKMTFWQVDFTEVCHLSYYPKFCYVSLFNTDDF
jgi:hypothetical protein